MFCDDRHVKLRISALIGLLACLSALVQGGCAQNTPTPSSEPVIVRFVCTAQEEPYYQLLVETFRKEHRHITIQLIRPRAYQWPEADVFAVDPFARRFMEQYDFPVLDLAGYAEHGETFDSKDFHPGLIELFRDRSEGEGRGELWAVPYRVDLGVMYYNRDLFGKYHVAPPKPDWTWDDFLRIGQALYRPGEGIFGYTPDEQYNDALAFIYQNGGRIFDDIGNPTCTTFDDPLTVEALEWYAGLMYEHEAAATPYQARQAYGIAGYIQIGIREGRLGMWSGGLSSRGGRLDAEPWPFAWGVVPLPRGKRSATFASAEGLVISSEAGYPDACWKWIEFLTRHVPLRGVPARKSVLASKAFENEVGKEVAVVARTSIEHALFFSPAGWDVYGAFQIYREAMEKIISGQTNAYEAMKWAQDKSSCQ